MATILAYRGRPSPARERERQELDRAVSDAEFALTQVFDRPAQGRVFFEQVLRENLDMGRPDHVQLIFDRRISRAPPRGIAPASSPTGSSRRCTSTTNTRASSSTTKKGARCAPRRVIDDTYDFDVGRRLSNLDDLKKLGFAANRRLLGVQRLSHDCTLGADVLDELHRPVCIDGHRASTLRFGDRRVRSLFAALLRFARPEGPPTDSPTANARRRERDPTATRGSDPG